MTHIDIEEYIKKTGNTTIDYAATEIAYLKGVADGMALGKSIDTDKQAS